MAETVGLASGLLALASFAFESSVSLFNTIQSYRNHPKRVRDLAQEAKALSEVLSLLADTINATAELDLSALELPLRRCGEACKEFEHELMKCSSRSGDDRTSFRDWAKLQYMGDGIDEFTQLLAGYKSTINIALTDANLRQSAITAESIENYQAMIKTATDDLEARLESIDGKLATIFERTVTETDSDAKELQRIKEERSSTQKCLEICAQLADHIQRIQLQSTPGPNLCSSSDADYANQVTNEGLQVCKERLSQTINRLEKHMQELINRLIEKSAAKMNSKVEATELTRLQEEWTTARQCLDICSSAESHVKQNISIIDNYARGDDTVQFLVSTNGKTIHGKNRGFGIMTRQVGGHLSDASLQQMSRDVRISLRASKPESSASQDDADAEDEQDVEFKGRYGRGLKLSDNSPDMEPPCQPTANQGRPHFAKHTSQ
ncbi:hypothetical protein KVR01_001413 [Diaporthe batatas]|uniref:uncharacterized protein n=1 Tax=Diaporthe batatas TaxID=748121 RepID=UPI001D04C1E5|nr:uncharacterized protein KVR01_001413 [Diaporthe batatas]KAG8168664.1 hypothetical protein KVR01_001413 [Diaporthe batatas]